MHVSLKFALRVAKTYRALRAGEWIATRDLISASRSAAKYLKAARNGGVTFDSTIRFPERVLYMLKAVRHLAEQRLEEAAVLVQEDQRAVAERYLELLQTEGVIADA